METCEQIKALVKWLKESLSSGCASYTVKGEWDGATKVRIEITCESWRDKWMNLLRDLIPYITIIISASIVGCQFGGCANKEDRNKADSEVRVHNIEASASVHINREVNQ